MVDKFTSPPSKDEEIAKINEIIDNLGGGGGTSTLSGLSDVTISNPDNGQVLEYNGTNWTNANKTIITFREWN